MQTAGSGINPVVLWSAMAVVLTVGAGVGLAYWLRHRRRRRAAHYLFTPLPCSFHPATFDSPKSLFDLVWDIGTSEEALELLQELDLLPAAGRLDYRGLNARLEHYVDRAGGYRNFVYRCHEQMREHPQLLAWEPRRFDSADGALVEYVGAEERRLESYVSNPTGLLQNRMVAFLYDEAKTRHAKKFGLALAFDYQSFQLLKRCIARDVRQTKDLLTYTGTEQYEAGLTGSKIKAVASGGGVALLEAAKGAGGTAATTTEVVSGLGAEAAAEVAAEGGLLASENLPGVLSIGHIAGQFVPIVQAVVLVYGGIHLGRIIWRKGQKSNAWLREWKLRGLQKLLADRLEALYGKYEELRDTQPPNRAPFAPAHELLALCEFEQQRLQNLSAEAAKRTGRGDLGVLRADLCRHAADVAAGLSRGLSVHLKALIRETDAHLAKGNTAEAALHLFLNKDLIFPPDVLDAAATREIATLAAEVAAEVRRLESS